MMVAAPTMRMKMTTGQKLKKKRQMPHGILTKTVSSSAETTQLLMMILILIGVKDLMGTIHKEQKYQKHHVSLNGTTHN
jgi:hypothetical protein